MQNSDELYVDTQINASGDLDISISASVYNPSLAVLIGSDTNDAVLEISGTSAFYGTEQFNFSLPSIADIDLNKNK